MKKITPQHNNEDALQEVLNEVASSPDKQVVARSFDEVMEMVTDSEFTRIPNTAEAPSNALVGMPKFMSNLQKIFAVSVPALAIVILVGYNTVAQNNVRQYEDIILAALEEEGAYEYEEYTEDYEDLFEESLLEEDAPILSEGSENRTVSQTQSGTQNTTEDIVEQAQQAQEELEVTLSAIDNIFADDDIDDSELNAWFADDSASDALFENYDI